MLELRDLVKHYSAAGGETVRAVDGVSLKVERGEMVALYGPSGSGKTTLLLMVATLLAPTAGSVLIGGRDISSLSEREASNFRLTELGFIRQNFDLLPGVSAIDNTVLKLLKAMRWRDAQRHVTPLLERLGMGERLYHRAETLSMGERQRVMIARALSTEPSLLLADEPTGSLDTQRGREVLELLRGLCRERGVAVVLVSHDPMAAEYADRVLALRDGHLSAYQYEQGSRARFTDRKRGLKVKLSNALRLYRVRLRARFLQECFAVLGIAAGVALLFASQVSSSSLQSSVAQLSRAIVGNANLQLVARDSHGFSESMLVKVRNIPGVRVAAPILEVNANAVGPHARESIELVGADPALAALRGTLLAHANLSPFGNIGAVALPAPLAKTIGVTQFGQEVKLQIAGHTVDAPLYEQLRERQIGALVATPLAISPLSYAQEMAGMSGRVSRILVQSAVGSQTRVRTALTALAGGHLNVESTAYDERLFVKAATVSNQSTDLFSVISALVGFLFAFNAMLLTVPQRRRLVADLRRDGYTPTTVIAVLLLDATALGLIGCALGLALGEELSIRLFHSNPGFLSLAFAVGSQRVVSWQNIAIAAGGGMLAASVAILSPLRDILSRDPLAAISPREGSSGARTGRRRALAGLACLAAATALLLTEPDAAIPGMALLLGALLLELPIVLSATLVLVKLIGSLIVSPIPHVAAMELGAARARAVAIAATGAVAVFGSVAIQGAHGDLLRGLEGAARDTNAATDIWVSPGGSYNLLHTTPFTPTDRTRLARLAGVRAVQLYRSSLLNYGYRRVVVVAPAREATPLLPAGQLLQGNARQAEARVRAGGWAVVSQGLAEEQHLHIGQVFTPPTPDPQSFRVAALSTNLGWAPGAILVNAADYARAWGSQDVSAYSVLLNPGVSPTKATQEIAHALGPGTGLAVQTAAGHAAQQVALGREALERLTQIATLIPLMAVLAMAAAMGAMVWQRRPRLAKLKLEGLPHVELWGTILLESLLLLGAGCLTGAVFGLYGQQLADRALAQVINFPVVHSVTALPALQSVSLVIATALAILAIPGYIAASVPPALALGD